MKTIMTLITGLLIGAFLGLWAGVNIGKEKPLLSNPLRETTMQEKLIHAGEDAFDKSSEVIEKSKNAIKEKFED